MRSPFISIKTIIVGAVIFCAVVGGAAFIGNSLSNSVARAPVTYTADTKAVATSVASTTTPATAVATTSTTIVSVPDKTTASAIATTTATPVITPLSLSITPTQIIEGDPVMITIKGGTTNDVTSTTGINSVANIKSATLTAPGPNMVGASATTPLHFLTYQNIPTAFYGTGIYQITGVATVTVVMKDGAKVSANFTITKRVSPTESLPVPAQLGGNSTSSQEQLLTNLDAENAVIANVYSNPSISFWTAPFTWPIHASDIPSVNGSPGGIVVTDPFGYNRDSGAETIVHKGTDFKAPPGTPIYAINAGYVRVAKLFTVYGNTIIVDHGMGIESFYMHLTKWVVTVGEPVKKGQLLGYSGETGYSEGPHLHLTIRVGGVSIDPMKFYAFFGVTL